MPIIVRNYHAQTKEIMRETEDIGGRKYTSIKAYML